MTSTLRLHHLAFSPNSVKVRMALGLKGIAHELVPVDPMDRTGVLALTGQPLTPALEHGDVRLFGSGAILRYLDANFRDTGPRLFSEDRDEFRAIEEWERKTSVLGASVGAVFGQFLSGVADAQASAAASEGIHAGTREIEERLADSPWLVGDSPTAADLTCAAVVYLSAVPEAAAQTNPIHAFFREHLRLGEGRERTRDWVARCVAYDR